MPGPGQRGPMGPRPKVKGSGKTLKNLLDFVTVKNRIYFIIVVLCIITSAVATTMSSVFLGDLIDEYITPMLSQTVPDFSGLVTALLYMAVIYAAGIFSSWLYNFLMVIISQGVLKSVRDKMFAHMQTLPIKYFDTHLHGDIMSRYTNDADTLRQMISQSIPQMLSSLISLSLIHI